MNGPQGRSHSPEERADGKITRKTREEGKREARLRSRIEAGEMREGDDGGKEGARSMLCVSLPRGLRMKVDQSAVCFPRIRAALQILPIHPPSGAQLQ